MREGGYGMIECDDCGDLLVQGDEGTDVVILGRDGGIFCVADARRRLPHNDSSGT
jgi:hypothetical protein